MVWMVGNNAMAVNFTTSAQQFKIYSNYVQGTYGAGFLGPSARAGTTQSGVAEIGLRSAELAGLCAIAHQQVAGTDVSLVITAGVPVKGRFDDAALDPVDGAGNPITLDSEGLLVGGSLEESIHVSDMFLNAEALTGYGNKLDGLNLGQSAESVAGSADLTWPTGEAGAMPTEGHFGLSAVHLNIAGLDGGTYGVNLKGRVNLPGFTMKVVPGTLSQADCPTQAVAP